MLSNPHLATCSFFIFHFELCIVHCEFCIPSFPLTSPLKKILLVIRFIKVTYDHSILN